MASAVRNGPFANRPSRGANPAESSGRAHPSDPAISEVARTRKPAPRAGASVGFSSELDLFGPPLDRSGLRVAGPPDSGQGPAYSPSHSGRQLAYPGGPELVDGSPDAGRPGADGGEAAGRMPYPA